jgi:hypothetical protein
LGCTVSFLCTGELNFLYQEANLPHGEDTVHVGYIKQSTISSEDSRQETSQKTGETCSPKSKSGQTWGKTQTTVEHSFKRFTVVRKRDRQKRFPFIFGATRDRNTVARHVDTTPGPEIFQDLKREPNKAFHDPSFLQGVVIRAYAPQRDYSQRASFYLLEGSVELDNR